MKLNPRVVKLVSLLAVLLSAPLAAVAHPGQHDEGTGLSHAFTQPDHLLALLGIVAALIYVPKIVRAVGARVARGRAPRCADGGDAH